jgi:hypothetical protein
MSVKYDVKLAYGWPVERNALARYLCKKETGVCVCVTSARLKTQCLCSNCVHRVFPPGIYMVESGFTYGHEPDIYLSLLPGDTAETSPSSIRDVPLDVKQHAENIVSDIQGTDSVCEPRIYALLYVH